MTARETTPSSDAALGLLDPAHGAQTGALEFFEAIYREAAGDPSRVPWAESRANPALVSWLNTEAAGCVRPGARAVVVGCGLGDDVIELINRGYDASGFDISPTAIAWARRRFPEMAHAFFVANLLEMPTRSRHRFDLVVESYTLQSVEPALREPLAAAIANLACPRGLIAAIATGRDESEPLESIHGPPYPLAPGELTGLFEAQGWLPTHGLDDFTDDATPPRRRLRATFARE
jgi:hypothetical protein